MNIKQAKEQIKNAIKAYFSKDEFGNYIVPIEKQRPVFLMGPPGIGKTAIMEQIAQELNIGLLSYSMTHHTRQSALGLPFIVHKKYNGIEFDVSEYTMSEIISSVYDLMEKSNAKEGILFLDEINCVSETLAPIMLQFLQYKIFGRHSVPKGWIVVTAGNPPEYNNSVREFDIVTWDRLKRIDLEPDYETWKEYAYKNSLHPSILSYLEIKKSDFYKIESSVSGKQFVTARAWEDLSTMIILYEKNNINIDKNLIVQYIQHDKIAKEFALYYDLFVKYRSDYQVDKILNASYSKDILIRAQKAKFDERLSLLGLILDALSEIFKEVLDLESLQIKLLSILKEIKLKVENNSVSDSLQGFIEQYHEKIKYGKAASNISQSDIRNLNKVLEKLYIYQKSVDSIQDNNSAFLILKQIFDKDTSILKSKAEIASNYLKNAFTFIEKAFENKQEMLIFVTELTINYYCMMFISKFGSKEYFNHNKELLFYERQKEIISQINELDLDN